MRLKTLIVIISYFSMNSILQVFSKCTRTGAHWKDACSFKDNEKQIGNLNDKTCGGKAKTKETDICCGVYKCDPLQSKIPLIADCDMVNIQCVFDGSCDTAALSYVRDITVCGNVNGCVDNDNQIGSCCGLVQCCELYQC